MHQQRKRYAQALPHAHREPSGALGPRVRKSHRPQNLIDAFLRKPQQRGTHAQVLAGGEVLVEGRLLDERADTVEVIAPPGTPLKEHLPLAGMQHARYHLERGRLTRPIGAEQPVDLPLLDMQGHVVHRRLRTPTTTKALGEPACLKDATRHMSLPSSRLLASPPSLDRIPKEALKVVATCSAAAREGRPGDRGLPALPCLTDTPYGYIVRSGFW